jgi:hypothetical protein
LQSSSSSDGTRNRQAAHGGVGRPGLVRLLFVVIILYWIAGEFMRKDVRQPYPGLYLPAFPGIGLLKMTASEGEVQVIRIMVHFADGTTEEAPRAALFGNDFFPTLFPSKYFSLGRETDKNAPLPADAKAFLAVRLQHLYPGRDITSVTFQALHEAFPLDHPNDRTVMNIDQERAIPFSP